MSEPDDTCLRDASVYERIYAIAGQIPPGRLASYGQIAAIEGRCTPRMVGYAMAAVGNRRVPWQRVINSRGMVNTSFGKPISGCFAESAVSNSRPNRF